MVYAYVMTRYPKWIFHFNSLRAVTRTVSDVEMAPGVVVLQHHPSTVTTTVAHYIPYAVEAVLELLTHEEREYGKQLKEHKSGAPAWSAQSIGVNAPGPKNVSLLTLPAHVLEKEWIIPAIELSQAEGPELP